MAPALSSELPSKEPALVPLGKGGCLAASSHCTFWSTVVFPAGHVPFCQAQAQPPHSRDSKPGVKQWWAARVSSPGPTLTFGDFLWATVVWGSCVLTFLPCSYERCQTRTVVWTLSPPSPTSCPFTFTGASPQWISCAPKSSFRTDTDLLMGVIIPALESLQLSQII